MLFGELYDVSSAYGAGDGHVQCWVRPVFNLPFWSLPDTSVLQGAVIELEVLFVDAADKHPCASPSQRITRIDRRIRYASTYIHASILAESTNQTIQ